ncbi:MAG: 3-phosphoshikimate 1-carboxyvinyltransferase [Chitinophagales bacterium]|nr:3-phosphoshikimate 1-carboxyvinyltransferase [Chitinophagales bacterium]
MIYRIRKKDRNISGSVALSGSKSISNRVLIIEALSGASIAKPNLATAHDTQLLQALLQSDSTTLDAEDAGTAFRFLTAFLAFKEGEWILTGNDRMQQRPIGGLVHALRSLGADITYLRKENFPPLKIGGGKLSGNHVKVSAGISSQFVSALLMIAPLMPHGLTIELEGKVVSEPYISMTLSLMQYFGVRYDQRDHTIHVPPQTYQPKDIFIESDWSAASYYYEMAALADEANIELKGLLEDSFQGDSVLASLMNSFGVETKFQNEVLTLSKTQSNSSYPHHYDLSAYPDLAPALFAAAAGLSRTVSFFGLEHLAYKESHRENALRTELAKCGISVNNDEGVITLLGKFSVAAPQFKTYNDHRMAMALAPLALVCGEVLIEDPLVVNKSYPDYWKDLMSIGFGIGEVK